MERECFGITKSGERVERFRLSNKNGVEIWILSLGCTIQKWLVPCEDGTVRDIVLGYDTLDEYERGTCYFGVVVGRYANRIKDAAFVLNGKQYTLSENDGKNHLHGIFENSVFQAEMDGEAVVFTRESPDGEEGYPGNLKVRVRYELTDKNILKIGYEAVSDKDTVINLTNHSYFNLNGQNGSSILEHTLFINADSMTESGAGCIPTGKIIPVKETPMDFSSKKTIGKDLFSGWEQIALAGGYDHNYCINGKPGELRSAAELHSEESGLTLFCRTTQPGMQFYCGVHVHEDKVRPGKNGVYYPKFGGCALETQHYPCSPNYPEFPSTVLRPGETYREMTEYEVH